MNEREDRFLGCLTGLAAGDAVGTTLEFRSPGTFKPIDDMVGGGPFDQTGRMDGRYLHSGMSSLATHGATTYVDACRYFGGLIWGALNGVPKEKLLSSKFTPVDDSWSTQPLCPAITVIAEGSFKLKNPPDIRGTGYVVKSLEAALWAFHSSADFRTGCLMAINLGDDADVTGAVYGQLAGAYYGYAAIPEAWRTKLRHHDLIATLAKQLMNLSSTNSITDGRRV